MNSQEEMLLTRVESDTTYKIRCSDCECYGDDFFNPEQAAELSFRDGWRVLGDNARAVCNTCAKGYPSL